MRSLLCRTTVALVALVTALSAASALAAPSRVEGTSTHIYAPFYGGTIATGVKVGRTASGFCTTSLSSTRPDAFRCVDSKFTYDPCFADETSPFPFVLCPLGWPPSRVIRINLTKALPTNNATGDPTRYGPPWAVRTANGKWCEIITRATGFIAGMRVNYDCTGGGSLLGNPRRGSSVWTIFYAPSFKSSDYQPVGITSAWW